MCTVRTGSSSQACDVYPETQVLKKRIHKQPRNEPPEFTQNHVEYVLNPALALELGLQVS